MGRLTNKKEADAQRKSYKRRLEQGYPRNIPEERFLKLASYEDTGLTPAQIKYILPKQSAEEAVKRMIDEKERYDEWFAWKQAEAEGRLVVLPCKVGDVVYQRDSYGNLYEATVQSIVIDNRRMIFITSGIGFDCDAIGKSVFLSREEVKKALER